MSQPQPSFWTRVFSLNGWWKILISLAPLLLLLIGAAISILVDPADDFLGPFIFPMFGIGAILSGVFTVQTIRSKRPTTHFALLFLAFVAVAQVYVLLSYWAIIVVVFSVWML